MIERVPEGKNYWKPHEKSMPLGYLARLVADMPSWIAMAINQGELDLAPGGKPTPKPPEWHSRRELVELLEKNVAQAREALNKTTDEHLTTHWRLLVNGQVVMDEPRYVVIRDSVFNHAAHHRGQLTVYLRLLNASVPAIYGPSADENSFREQVASVGSFEGWLGILWYRGLRATTSEEVTDRERTVTGERVA